MSSTTASQTNAMIQTRRTQSEAKHRAVHIAIDACVAHGITDSAASIARKAAVTETFLYRHEAEPCPLCAQTFAMGPITYLRTQMARILDSREVGAQEQGHVTAATLKTDLANSHAANQRLQRRLKSLEYRLGEILGQNAQETLPELSRLAQGSGPNSEKRIRDLSEQTAALQSLLAEREEELDAVRRLNADLTRRLNA